MRSFYLLILPLAFVLLGCSGDSGEVVTYTDRDSGAEILVETGEEFEIRLDSNPSTGYGWDLLAESGTDSVELLARRHEPAETEQVGASGEDVFLFEAIGGAEILRLEYIRQFDQPAVPERVVEYIVRVDSAPWPHNETEPPATSSSTAPIEISALLDSDVPIQATVIGYLVWDSTGARLCEVLMESFPPQCGGSFVAMANPESFTAELRQEQSVRWSDDRVQVTGTFDGMRLTLS